MPAVITVTACANGASANHRTCWRYMLICLIKDYCIHSKPGRNYVRTYYAKTPRKWPSYCILNTKSLPIALAARSCD